MHPRLHTVHPYPNAWRSPYSMELNAEFCRRYALRWLVGALVALMLDVGYVGTSLVGWLTVPDAMLFGAATTILGTTALVRYALNRQRARRMDEVRGIWTTMLDAPHSWRSLALSRQAYAYCEQDDTGRLIAVGSATVLAAVVLLGVGVLALAGIVVPGAVWLCGAMGVAMLAAMMCTVFLRRRSAARKPLHHVLGPRENRPPDMRLSPHRYWDAV